MAAYPNAYNWKRGKRWYGRNGRKSGGSRGGYGRKRLALGRKSARYGASTSSDKASELRPESFKTVGAHGDSSFLDTSSVNYYAWSELNPLYGQSSNKPQGKSGRLPSLKLLCSRIVAENSADLNGAMLETLSVPCKKMIWNHILVSHNDSMSAFVTFATTMFGIDSFRCHGPKVKANDPSIEIRQDYLSNCLIPNIRNHRIENIFSNVNIDYLTSYLNGLRLQNMTLLDFSQTPDLLQREHLLLLFKVRSLAGLDVSNSNTVDDSILHYLVMAIKSEILPNLRVLRISNCKKLSKPAIESLFSLAESPVSSFSLIICDDIFPVSFQEKLTTTTTERSGSQIPGTKWVSYNHEWDHSKLLMKFPLAFQYHYLLHQLKHRVPKSSISVDEYVLLDIMFLDQSYGFDSEYYMLDYVSKCRLNSRNRFSSTETCLLIDVNLDVKPNVTAIPQPKASDSIFTSVGTKSKTVRPRLKPKRKNVNVDDYF